ncbi:MAG: hypothetical protein DHS20C18_21700 [Saprospiraceae bacterium]|nr:MAG: hypothetical protein DHS20C18_21700 [Saprospiraceae bacterium]
MFGGWAENEENNFWMSYTDLVTGFMIIFMVISLALSLLKGEKKVLESKYAELIGEFEEVFKDQNAIEIADSATIRFTIQDKSLFQLRNHKPTPYFESVLDSFIPLYYSRLETFYNESRDSFTIQEIRIEGHTDSLGDYVNNLITSSARAMEIQKYIVRHDYFKNLDPDFQNFVLSNSIACGYAYTRPLDTAGVSKTSMEQIYDADRSRRVEFRVLIEYNEK